MTDDVWLPIDISQWRGVPCLSDRIAREEDVGSGRAVFFLENPEEINAHPLDVNVPRCAISPMSNHTKKSRFWSSRLSRLMIGYVG